MKMSEEMSKEMSFDAAPDPQEGKTLNLYQKLAQIKLAVGYIQKRGKHPSKNFAFTQSVDIRRELREEMASRNVELVPEGVESIQHTVERPTKTGSYSVTQTQLKMRFTFINGDNPSEKIPCDWICWSEGSEAFAAYGCYTGGQRHFLDSYFMLLTGEKDPEKWSSEMEAEYARIRQRESAKVEPKVPGKKVGGAGYTPTKEDLEDSDTSNVDDPEEPLDESWRIWPLTMARGLAERYKGKFVGDISLKHLVDAVRVFVANVQSHQVGYTAPGHHQLANALVARLMWEIDHGTIIESINPDGTYKHQIVEKVP